MPYVPMTDLMLLSHCRWVVICKISEGIPWHYCKNITVKQRQSPHTSTHAYKENHTTHTYTKAQEESYRQVFKVYSHFHQVAKWKPWGNIQQIVRLIWVFFWKAGWFFWFKKCSETLGWVTLKVLFLLGVPAMNFWLYFLDTLH